MKPLKGVGYKIWFSWRRRAKNIWGIILEEASNGGLDFWEKGQEKYFWVKFWVRFLWENERLNTLTKYVNECEIDI